MIGRKIGATTLARNRPVSQDAFSAQSTATHRPARRATESTKQPTSRPRQYEHGQTAVHPKRAPTLESSPPYETRGRRPGESLGRSRWVNTSQTPQRTSAKARRALLKGPCMNSNRQSPREGVPLGLGPEGTRCLRHRKTNSLQLSPHQTPRHTVAELGEAPAPSPRAPRRAVSPRLFAHRSITGRRCAPPQPSRATSWAAQIAARTSWPERPPLARMPRRRSCP